MPSDFHRRLALLTRSTQPEALRSFPFVQTFPSSRSIRMPPAASLDSWAGTLSETRESFAWAGSRKRGQREAYPSFSMTTETVMALLVLISESGLTPAPTTPHVQLTVTVISAPLAAVVISVGEVVTV